MSLNRVRHCFHRRANHDYGKLSKAVIIKVNVTAATAVACSATARFVGSAVIRGDEGAPVWRKMRCLLSGASLRLNHHARPGKEVTWSCAKKGLPRLILPASLGPQHRAKRILNIFLLHAFQIIVELSDSMGSNGRNMSFHLGGMLCRLLRMFVTGNLSLSA